jgi:hypothetical protein
MYCTYTIQVRVWGIRQNKTSSKKWEKRETISQCQKRDSWVNAWIINQQTRRPRLTLVPHLCRCVGMTSAELAHRTQHILFSLSKKTTLASLSLLSSSFFAISFVRRWPNSQITQLFFFFLFRGKKMVGVFWFLSRPGRPPPCHATGRKWGRYSTRLFLLTNS